MTYLCVEIGKHRFVYEQKFQNSYSDSEGFVCAFYLFMLPASCTNFDFAAVVHPMSHTVGSQQQSLNSASSGTSGSQILSPSQGQSPAETFYNSATSPQDISQPSTVDSLAASLGT